MLPPFIIEQIRKREEEEARPERQPVLELPMPLGPATPARKREEDSDRGVIIIDLIA